MAAAAAVRLVRFGYAPASRTAYATHAARLSTAAAAPAATASMGSALRLSPALEERVRQAAERHRAIRMQLEDEASATVKSAGFPPHLCHVHSVLTHACGPLNSPATWCQLPPNQLAEYSREASKLEPLALAYDELTRRRNVRRQACCRVRPTALADAIVARPSWSRRVPP